MNYGAGYFGPVHDVTTPAECCSLCAQTKGCVAWNVNMGLNRQNCWLKDNDKGGPDSRGNRYSGKLPQIGPHSAPGNDPESGNHGHGGTIFLVVLILLLVSYLSI